MVLPPHVVTSLQMRPYGSSRYTQIVRLASALESSVRRAFAPARYLRDSRGFGGVCPVYRRGGADEVGVTASGAALMRPQVLHREATKNLPMPPASRQRIHVRVALEKNPHLGGRADFRGIHQGSLAGSGEGTDPGSDREPFDAQEAYRSAHAAAASDPVNFGGFQGKVAPVGAAAQVSPVA
jgi:hypothetical protein